MTSLRVDFRRRRERRVGDRRDRRGIIVEGGVFLCGAPARGVGKYPGPAGAGVENFRVFIEGGPGVVRGGVRRPEPVLGAGEFCCGRPAPVGGHVAPHR